MLYIPSLDILYRGTESGFGTPVLDDRRALEAQIDFAEQGGTVVDQHAVFDGDQPYPLTCQRFADFPLPALHLDFPLQIHLQHPGSRWILPLWWLRIVPPTAGPPHTGGSSHVQGFVRAHVVVFPSVSIQPRLQVLARNSSPAPRPLQRSRGSARLFLASADDAPRSSTTECPGASAIAITSFFRMVPAGSTTVYRDPSASLRELRSSERRFPTALAPVGHRCCRSLPARRHSGCDHPAPKVDPRAAAIPWAL